MAKTKSPAEPSIGHNGAMGGNSKAQLKSIVERVERIETQRAELAADVREIISEAKSSGFDTAAIRHTIKERKLTPTQRSERNALRDTYMSALGGLADLPLGQAAISREFSSEDMPRQAMGS